METDYGERLDPFDPYILALALSSIKSLTHRDKKILMLLYNYLKDTKLKSGEIDPVRYVIMLILGFENFM